MSKPLIAVLLILSAFAFQVLADDTRSQNRIPKWVDGNGIVIGVALHHPTLCSNLPAVGLALGARRFLACMDLNRLAEDGATLLPRILTTSDLFYDGPNCTGNVYIIGRSSSSQRENYGYDDIGAHGNVIYRRRTIAESTFTPSSRSLAGSGDCALWQAGALPLSPAVVAFDFSSMTRPVRIVF